MPKLLELVSLFSGGIIGWFLVWLDKIAYIYILHPEAQISQYFKYHLERKNFKAGWELIKKRALEFDKLTSRGILFQLAWFVLAVFVLTSTAGWFGKALVMGLGLRILAEEVREFFGNRQALQQKLFWQVKSEVSNQELKWYMIAKVLVFGWLTAMIV